MRFLCALLCAIPLLASDVAVAPSSLTFAYQFNSLALPSQAIVITGPQSMLVTASRPGDQNWLVLGNSGSANVPVTAPGALSVAVNPQALSVGTYTTAITLRFPDGVISIPVTVLVTISPVILASPAIVFFDAVSAPSANVATGISSNAPFVTTATTTTPWVTVQGTTQFVATANRNTAGTALSSGSFQVHSSPLIFAANNPLTVPVVLLGNGLSSRGPLALGSPALTFTGAGSQTVAVNGGTFTASSDAKWLTAAVSGQNLTVTVNPAGLALGSYQATITLNSAGVLQMLPVTLTTASPQLTSVLNAASYGGGAISPGEVVTLFGSALGPANLAGLALDGSGAVSNSLAGVQVLFNGIAAPLVYVSGTQLAAVAPYDLDGQSNADVQIVYNGVKSNVVNVPVTSSAPGIFTADASGKGAAAILKTGDVVSIYMTGEGQTSPGGVNGRVTQAPPLPRLPVTATIDGQSAEVLFAGEAPGIVSGVMQVNLRIPPTARSGDLPVVISVGGTPTQSGVTVANR